MAKVLNQLLYSSVVFGSDLPSGVLRLESTSSGTKGAVEIVGTHTDFITDTGIGRLVHTNTTTRIYDLPDYSGQVLISGIFTGANQLLYSSAAGVYAMLPSTVGGALVTLAAGDIAWETGSDDQVLTIVGGVPAFTDLPDAGFINPSPTAHQLAYYVLPGNDLSPITTVASRTLLSSVSGTLSWGLLDATYLRASGGVPLGVGVSAQVLTAVGDGSFVWANKNPAVINPGTQYRVPYYSGTTPGTTISESSFLQVDETFRSLMLQNRGSVRFYEATVNGASYLEIKAPLSLGPSVVWTLPATDGLPGALLQTDGLGNLAFNIIDNGTVNAGLTNQMAYYASVGNDVSGLTTTAARILGSSALGVPTWMLIKESYLSTTGSGPLGAGALNQVLVSNGATEFLWANAVDITGEVLSGVANYLAFYPNTGTKVDDTSFLSIDNTLKILNLLDGTKLRIYPASSSNYLGFQAPALASNVSWILPALDGAPGYALGTDGSGNLSFIEVGRGIIHDGAAMTLAYYQAANDEVYSWTNVASRVALTTALNEIAWNLITTEYLSGTGGVPLTVGTPNYALTPDGLGSFAWVDMVTIVGKVNLGSAGRLAFYAFDGNQIYNSLWLNNAELAKTLELLDGGSLKFYESTNTYSTTLQASPDLTASTTLILPPNVPTENGYVLTGETDGTLLFREPSSDTRWEQRGVINLAPGMRSVTIIYDTPFTQKPSWIDTQWVVGEDNIYLPTYAVEKSTTEGFIVRFSTAIPTGGIYQINWQSYLMSSVTDTISLYIAGGRDGSGYLDSLMNIKVDIDTAIALSATMSSPRGYTCGGGSSVKGYIFGGSSPVPLPLSIITSFTYSTSVLTDLSTTLITARSGAAGVGQRSKTYVAGGETPGGINYSSIEAFDTVTETISSIGSTLANPSVSAGTATSYNKGAIVHSGLASMELFTYATETLAVSGATFGATDISVGANDAGNNKGYFGRNAGYVYAYNFGLDTLSILPATLNSTTGLSSAGNSLDRAYFAGSSLVDSLDFSTGTIATVTNLLSSGHMSAASSTFQSKGLL